MAEAPDGAVSQPAAGSRAGGRFELRQIAVNALSGGGRYVVSAALALLVTPYALAVLGSESFGLWALAGAVLASVQLCDLGLNRALVRAVAGSSGQGDLGSARETVATARSLALALGLAAAAVVWALRGALAGALFRVPAPLTGQAAYVFVGAAAIAGVQTAFAPFQAILDGTGRMDLSNAVDTAQRILSAVGTVLVLAAGLGLVGLVWKNLCTAALAGLAYRRLARSEAPTLAGSGMRPSWRRAKGLLGYGRHVQTVNLGMALVDPGAKAILARAAGLEAVAIWELAWRVVGTLSSAFLAFATALFPAAAAAGATARGDAAVAALSERARRYLSWLALPAYGELAALAPAFTALWLGPSHGPVARAIALLVPGWLLAVLSTPAFLVAQATGRERLATAASLVTVAGGLGLAAGLYGPVGSEGVVGGVSAGLAAGGLAALALFGRAYGLGFRPLVPFGWREAVAALAATAAARIVVDALPLSLPALAIAAAAGLAAFAALLAGLGAVTPADRSLLASLLPRRQGGTPG